MLRPILLALTLAAAPALAADASKPHPHQGVVPHIEGAPEKPALTADDLATLAKGEPVLKQVKNADGSGRGIAVQDIEADAATVWSKITDYGNYPDYVSEVRETEVYARDGETIKVRFVLKAMMMTIEYFVDHVYRPDDNYLTWTLDYSRESDLDDSVGFWYVEPIDDDTTRVYYSVSVKLGGWVPGMVENMIAKSGLTQATSWVKRESEGG